METTERPPPPKLYQYAPITEEDEVVTVNMPGLGETKMLIFEECSKVLVDGKNGISVDPRIVIPQTQNMEVFEDDVFICAYPKCGTHWVWEMCQMLVKGKAEYHSKAKESCMLEFHLPEDYKDLDRPRIFNTHYNPRCLPRKMSEKMCKLIIIQRNPKDIYTSMYHHMINTRMFPIKPVTFSEFLHSQLENDLETSSNWLFYNIKWSDFLASTEQPYLVLMYEDLKMNPMKSLIELAGFLGYHRDEELLKEILEKCTVDKMKEMEKNRDSGTDVADSNQVSVLYRKGVVGDWKNYFTVADNERFDALLKQNVSKEGNVFIYE